MSNVSLLEFKPDQQGGAKIKCDNSDFDVLFDNDVWFNLTPDLPKLRYEKNILVFMWDELKSYKKYLDAGLLSGDYHTKSYLSKSKDLYLPFANVAENKATKQDLLLPKNNGWNSHVNDFENFADPKRLSGRILTVSVRGLQALDLYYGNGSIHTRSKEKFYTQNVGGEIQEAWLYSMPTQAFLKYRPHESGYTLLKGFEPSVCPTVSDSYTGIHVQKIAGTHKRHDT